MSIDPDPRRVRALIDRLGAAIFVVDVEPDGGFRFVATNLVHERKSGLRRADLAGRRLEECLPPEMARSLAGRYRACVAAGEAIEYEEQLDLAVGRTWWRTTLTPELDADGAVVQLYGTTVDITEARRDEQASRRKTVLLEEAEELAGIGHWKHDLQSDTLLCSAGMLRIHGLPEDAAPSLEQIRALYHPDDLSTLLACRQRALAQGEPFFYEVRLRRGDGSERRVRGRGRCETDSNGQLTAIFGVVRDVTEERRQEELAREGEAQYRHLCNATPTMLHSLDRQGRLVRVSDYWLATLGYDREEVLGRPVTDFMTADSRRVAEKTIFPRFWERGHLRDVEHRFVCKDGRTIDVVLSAEAERDEQGRIVRSLSVLTDITARKQAERALARAQQRLAEAIESMSDAFALFDEQGRLEIFNQRCKEIYPLIEDLMVPGARYEDLVRATVERGLFVVDQKDRDAWVRKQVQIHLRGKRDYEMHLGDGRWIQVSTRRTRDGGVVSTRRDVTRRKQMEFAISHMAMHDALTGLPNRAMFGEELERALARAERDGRPFAVMMGDLDGFKCVNDSMGHATGDRLLVEVARRLQGGVRGGDLVARLGGDEFAILAFADGRPHAFGALADRLVDLMRGPFEIDGQAVSCGMSLGIAVCPDHARDGEQLMINADLALYAAKAAGRHGWRAFERGMAGRAETAASMELSLRNAIALDQLLLHFQPIMEMAGGRPVGAEALLRWNHPSRGLLGAGAFLPATEHRPVIVPVTRWTLAEALRQQGSWRDAGLDLPVWVNLAARSFRWDGLVQVVAEELERAGAAPDRLVLEITEGSFADLFRAESQIAALQEMGVRIALDDFGAGHSSLVRLRDVTVDVLKIDQTLVGSLAANGRDDAIVQAVVALGKSLGVMTLAEGIETEAQYRLLRRVGCPYGQGYHFARPMPPATFLDWACRHLLPPVEETRPAIRA